MAVSPLNHLVVNILRLNLASFRAILNEIQCILILLRSIGGVEWIPLHFTKLFYAMSLYRVACNLEVASVFPQLIVSKPSLVL